MKPRKSIQPEFIVKVCLLSLVIALVFSVLNFLFLFVVEDEFLDRGLSQEKQKTLSVYETTGKWEQPDNPNIQLYFSLETLPDSIGEILRESPQQKEFYGQEGRHYHLTRLDNDVFLVYEVSSLLIVRPMRTGLIIFYGITALIITGVACYMAYRMARKTIRPLGQLAQHIAQIDPEAEPKKFAQEYPNNEIGLLAEQLEGSLRRVHDFIEREKQFSRDVSHDLRTPLAVAAGACELMEKEGQSAEDRRHLLARQKIAHAHMDLTITALLSMVREKQQNSVVAQSLMPILENVILQYSYQLDGKDIELDIQVPGSASVSAPDGVLEILLSNILSNAFQYTEAGTIGIHFKDGRLSVSDTGGGMPDQIKSGLFVKNIKSDHSSGYGLGLSLVKRVCEYHDIGLEVEHRMAGTVIHLHFP
ncbi:two-component sensor histidine kinase [Kordiimonas sediminis]|uniref:histidine kinase n=1 Tax=Kordiimonas sediminis TaxID=1735581 RepID=A0A919AUD5_9PROT|nr:HAMP domain-containing sensor histidine kinase [Kordiimonas sediminis]GHF24216.1 two-component sensor histidine kinase [Kordiimonas sediminis]